MIISLYYISRLMLSVFGQLRESSADVSSVLTLQMNDLYQIDFSKDVLNQFYTCLCDSKDQSCSVLLERDTSFSYQARVISVSRFPSYVNQSQEVTYSRNFICSVPTSFHAHQTIGCIRLKHAENVCENLELCESINLIYGSPCENGFAGVFWLYPGRIHQKIDNRYVSLSQCGGDCFNRTSPMTSVVTPGRVVTVKTDGRSSVSTTNATPATVASTTTAEHGAGMPLWSLTGGVKRVSSSHQETSKPTHPLIDIEVDVELIVIIAVSSGVFVVLLSIFICVICVYKRKRDKPSGPIKTKKRISSLGGEMNGCYLKPPKRVAYLCEAARQTGSAIVLANEMPSSGIMCKEATQSELTQSETPQSSQEQILMNQRNYMREMLILRDRMQAEFVETELGNDDVNQNASELSDGKTLYLNNGRSDSLSESLIYEDVKKTDPVKDHSRRYIRDDTQSETKRISHPDEECYTTINDVTSNEKNVYTRLNEEVKLFSNPYSKLQSPCGISHEQSFESVTRIYSRFSTNKCLPDCSRFATNGCIKSCSESFRYNNLFPQGKSEEDSGLHEMSLDVNSSSVLNLCAQKHIYFELEEDYESTSEYSASYEDEIIL